MWKWWHQNDVSEISERLYLSLRKMKRYRSQMCLLMVSYRTFFVEGEKMLLQKCPKPFYNDCCRFLLKTVTKCCFRNFPNSFYNDCCRFLLKTVAKCCFRNFPLFCKLRVVPDFSQWRSKDTASEISETIFTIKDVPDFS